MKQSKFHAIGLTGGIGAGKSVVMNYLKKSCNCSILLADEAAHDVEKKGTECYEKLVALLGTEILSENGEIDRIKMASEIFSNPEYLDKVNKIVHPAVKDYILGTMERLEREGNVAFFFVEAALLLEEKYDEILDEIWYIYADEEIRTKRLMTDRGYSEQKIKSILNQQLKDEEFRKRCNYTIENNGDLDKTFSQIDHKLEEYL